MTRKVNGIVVAGLFALLVAGCGKPEDKYVGRYAGKLTLTDKANEQLNAMGPNGQQVRDQLNKLSMDLDLRKDKTFTLSANMMNQKTESTGTWALAEKQITLTPTSSTVNGKKSSAPNTPTKLLLGDDPNVLTADTSSNPQAAQMGGLTFTRSG